MNKPHLKIEARRECVYFDASKNFDTHKAYNDGIYTFVTTGHYVVVDAEGAKLIYATAGETLKAPTLVVCESCRMFYQDALKLLPKESL